MKTVHAAIIVGLCIAADPAASEVFSINDALRQTIQTNPGVGEASANRRATESELPQTQSTLLPQVRIDASVGPAKFDQSPGVRGSVLGSTVGSGPCRTGNQASGVVG